MTTFTARTPERLFLMFASMRSVLESVRRRPDGDVRAARGGSWETPC